MLAAASDAPVSDDAATFSSRVLKGTLTLQDGDHDVWVLRVEAGDTLGEMPAPGRLVPMESWILMGQERLEHLALIEQLQSKPEWWMVGIGALIGAGLGIGT